jgi:O-antigen ligase
MASEITVAVRADAGARVALVRALPSLSLALAAWLLAWHEQGSLLAGDWLPAAIFATFVLATVLASRTAAMPSRSTFLGLAGLAGLAAWAALSIAWSPSPSGARDEALLVAMYAVAFAVPALTLRTERERLVALQLFAAGMLVVAIATAVTLIVATAPSDLFYGGRLNRPISYVNAAAALFALGFWPAVTLAARNRGSLVSRVVAGGAAAAFLAVPLAAQSKGSALGLIVSTIIFFAAVPGRLRRLVPAAIAFAVVAAESTVLTAPYRASTQAEIDSSIHRVGIAVLVAAAAGCALCVIFALVDRRVAIGARTQRRIGIGVLALVAAGLITGVAVFFASVSSPSHFFSHQWQSFKRQPTTATGSTHLLALGSYRYDVWRVALHQFEDHPLQGIGARGFYSAYLRERHSSETPLRAHSLYFDTLGEEGIVGFALLALALGPPLWLVFRRRRRAAAAGALGSCVWFLAHASADWIWTTPALGILFFVLLGIGASSDNGPPLPTQASLPSAAALVALALVVFAPPYLAYRFDLDAVRYPASANRDLRWARRLDSLSLDPLWTRWQLASTPAQRIATLEEMRRKEPDNVTAAYQLGIAELRVGRRQAALRDLQEALRLDPREPEIRKALLTASR